MRANGFAFSVDELRECAAATAFDAPPAERPAHSRANEIVYFVGGLAGPVKIGWTQQPIKARLKCIQNGSPIKLHVLATQCAPRAKERWYHRQFAAARLHGEWFERTPELQDVIDRLCAGYVPAAFGHVVQLEPTEPLGFSA